jgi:high-affinity iron transporter
MFPGFVLSLREGLEAALVIGIVLGAVRKMNRPDLRSAVWSGVVIAAAAALLAAIGLNLIGAEFKGTSEQIFEGAMMFLAAGLLTWMIFWMRRQSGAMKRELESGVQQAALGGKRGLFALAFFAVGRELLELALFLVAARMTSDVVQTSLGAAFGLAGAAVLGYALFAGSRRMDIKTFFLVTNMLLIIFAAGLVAAGVSEFNEAGLIPAVVSPLWNTGGLLSDAAGLGAVLKALFGYQAAPSLTAVAAYLAYFAIIVSALRRPANGERQPSTA